MKYEIETDISGTFDARPLGLSAFGLCNSKEVLIKLMFQFDWINKGEICSLSPFKRHKKLIYLKRSALLKLRMRGSIL